MPDTRLSLRVGKWPNWKRPALWIYGSETNEASILAWFVSDRALEAFLNCAKAGIVLEDVVPAPPDPLYPCAHPGCKVMRTEDEGGRTFTVCDDHWKVPDDAA